MSLPAALAHSPEPDPASPAVPELTVVVPCYKERPNVAPPSVRVLGLIADLRGAGGLAPGRRSW